MALTTTTSSTNTVFKNENKFSLEIKDDDYRYVKAKKTIKKGELLLVEHCYLSKKLDFIRNIISHSPELFNNLYPRKEKWTEETEEGRTEDFAKLVTEKAQKNAFVHDNRYSVGFEISNFNHSTNPNACVRTQAYIIDENVSVYILFVFAVKNIKKGKEITISYGKSYFDDDACEIDYGLVTTKTTNLVHEIMAKYLRTETCLDMVVNHISIFYGLYILSDGTVCPTRRFTETFNIDLSLPSIINWLYEKRVEYYKK